MQNVSLNLLADEESGYIEESAGQGVGSGMGAERVAEKQDHCAHDRGHQHRQRYAAPVLNRGSPEILGRLPPFTFETVNGRKDHEDHQRDLEVEIDYGQAHEGVEAESGFIWVYPKYLEQGRNHPNAAQGVDESGREGNASEV